MDQASAADSPAKPSSLDVLATFQCPRGGQLCDLHNLSSCPFAHSADDDDYKRTRQLPPYACVKHLLGSCCNPEAAVGGQNGLRHCPLGFHMTLEELVDLEHFSEKMAAVIRASVPSPRQATKRPLSPTSEESHDCGICKDPVSSSFGLLASCSHAFCAGCLLSWFEEATSSRTCPLCRQHSNFVFTWPAMVSSAEEKRVIWEMQRRAENMTHKLGGTLANAISTNERVRWQEFNVVEVYPNREALQILAEAPTTQYEAVETTRPPVNRRVSGRNRRPPTRYRDCCN